MATWTPLTPWPPWHYELTYGLCSQPNFMRAPPQVNPHMPWGPPEGQEQQELKQQQWEQQWAGQEMGKVV